MIARGSLVTVDEDGRTVPIEALRVGDTVYLPNTDQYAQVAKVRTVVDHGPSSAVVVPGGAIWNGVPRRDLVLDADQLITVPLRSAADASGVRGELVKARELGCLGFQTSVLAQSEVQYFDIELENHGSLNVEGVIACVNRHHPVQPALPMVA